MKIDLSKYRTQAQKLAYLVENKKALIEFKSSGGYKRADAVGGSDLEAKLSKALNTNFQDDPASGTIKRTIILNTYNWMDSHDDVHLDGVFSKSISKSTTDIFHLHDHEYKLTSRVGNPENFYEKEVNWSDLGVNKIGTTMGLFMDSNISRKMNEIIYDDYLNNRIKQHSVGMIYVDIELAVNDSQYKDENAVWNKYAYLIGNRDRAEEKGYFWAVKQADLIEGSAVLKGSNELTPTVMNQPKGANKINLQYLINNL